MKRMPTEERFRKPVEVAARVIGWLVGLGLTSTGIAGAAYCLLHWTSFLFGFRYFAGMAKRSKAMRKSSESGRVVKSALCFAPARLRISIASCNAQLAER